MPAFLEDITPFLGTGEKNEDGLTLPEFLEEYDPYEYKNPSVTTDVLVLLHPHDFKTVETGMKVLMVKRRNHPSIGYWALPGGFVNVDEDLEVAAKRELLEETGLKDISIEMVTTYGEADRDPRGRIITSAYVALIDETTSMPKVEAGDDAADAVFVDIVLKHKSCTTEIRDGKEKVVDIFSLKLSNQEKNLSMKALVERSKNVQGFLKEEHFKVIENEGIAFDHPRFIVETLLYVEKDLSNSQISL